MAKSPADLMPLLDAIRMRTGSTSSTQEYPPDNINQWNDVSIGFVDPDFWKVLDWPGRPKDDTDEQIVSPDASQEVIVYLFVA